MSLSKLPAELIDKIYENLAVPDQICLAFTNSSFYNHLLCITKSPRLPKLPLQPDRQLIFGSNVEREARVDLLRRLDNRKLDKDACTECDLLYGGQILFQESDQIVNICPCSYLTFENRSLLIELLLRYPKRESLARKCVPGWIFKACGYSPQHPFNYTISHDCEIQVHDTVVKVYTEIYARWKDSSHKDKHLDVSNDYAFFATTTERDYISTEELVERFSTSTRFDSYVGFDSTAVVKYESPIAQQLASFLYIQVDKRLVSNK